MVVNCASANLDNILRNKFLKSTEENLMKKLNVFLVNQSISWKFHARSVPCTVWLNVDFFYNLLLFQKHIT